MSHYDFELPSATPQDDIAQYIPLLVSAVDMALNNAYSWADPVAGQEKMELLIKWITENLPCAGGDMRQLGEIILSASGNVPSGFLACDGSAVSRTTYAALFAEIGTNYGVGDGSTTFNLPDLRGRAPIGVGQGSGLSNRALGDSVGNETHTLTTAQLPVHNHRLDNSYGADLWRADGSNTGNVIPVTNVSNTVFSRLTTENTGSGSSHNNMQPSLTTSFFIYSGV